MIIWHGLYAPKGTPKAVTDKINAALRSALKDPEFIKRQEALGAWWSPTPASAGPSTRNSSSARSPSGAPSIKAAGQYAD